MNSEQIINLFNNRYACKNFDSSKKITDEDFETIIETARLSPSSFGMEPWKFLLIENQQFKKDIREFSWGALNSLNGASHFIIALSRKNLVADSEYVNYISKNIQKIPIEYSEQQLVNFTNFQKNDFQLLSNQRFLFDWASKQSYIALANMMTSAQMLGIDSCPIEGFNKHKVENYLSDNNYIDSNEFGVSYMVGFGYSNEDRPKKIRQPMKNIFEIIK